MDLADRMYDLMRWTGSSFSEHAFISAKKDGHEPITQPIITQKCKGKAPVSRVKLIPITKPPKYWVVKLLCIITASFACLFLLGIFLNNTQSKHPPYIYNVPITIK